MDKGEGSPNTNMVTSSTNENANLQEPLQMVQTLLQEMQDKFQTMTEQFISRIDEMGQRIDEIESNISELMQQSDMGDDSGQTEQGTAEQITSTNANANVNQ